MALYRVRAGARLPHIGRIYEAGDVVELPDALAADKAIEARVEPMPVERPVATARPARAKPVEDKPTPTPAPLKE